VRGAECEAVEVFDLMGGLVFVTELQNFQDLQVSSLTELHNFQDLQVSSSAGGQIASAGGQIASAGGQIASLGERLSVTASFAAGVYVVRCGGKSVKVVVR
jgi:hypothetical protein